MRAYRGLLHFVGRAGKRLGVRFLLISLVVLLLAIAQASADDGAEPATQARAFRDYFIRKFPNVKLDDFVNGPYALNEDMRRQWEEKEQFPPYEFSLEAGKELFAKPFANGKHYADCFRDQGIGVRRSTSVARPTARSRSPIPATIWPH